MSQTISPQAQVIHPNASAYTSQETHIPLAKVSATLELLIQEECTVPFITRYRKEKTGGLNEEQIREIQGIYEKFIEREKRREYILETINKREMLTPELEKKIKTATTINQLEDLYAPYKVKRKTKGQKAKEAGLNLLAESILKGEKKLEQLKRQTDHWHNPEKGIKSWEDALSGASFIIIEHFAHDIEIKEQLRQNYWREAQLVSSKRKNAEEIKDSHKYKDYFNFTQSLQELKRAKAGHRFLAMRRGMTQKVLKVEIKYEESVAIKLIQKKHFPKNTHPFFELLYECAKKAITTSIHPSLDLEIKTELKKISDESAIHVFNVNLKNLLLQPYLGSQAVLALDPGIRTGCKTVVVDKTGKFLFDTVIYPHPPQNDTKGSIETLSRLIDHFQIEYIAIGNGTFGRETLQFVENNIAMIKENKTKVVLVNESGASIYSTSEVAKQEFPDKDATIRGAISIARRFQDPLAELVKIDPKSIGVGQYQHDLNQSKLKKSLSGVVEDCVNYVGVDINTASPHLLSYISGIGPNLAHNIVKMREKQGGFKHRQEFLKIPRFNQKVFIQAAGFLKVYQGENPLDRTFIHPERYDVLSTWVKNQGLELKTLVENEEVISNLEEDKTFKDEVGSFTHIDIINSLRAPGQDPRQEFKTTEFRKDIKTIEDLKTGQLYPGIVTNITNFGAFIDIGIKENGLIHISEMANRFVENPLELLKIGQEVKAKVIGVDRDRGRISLSLKTEKSEKTLKASNNKKKSPPKNRKKTHNPSHSSFQNKAFASLKNFKIK